MREKKVYVEKHLCAQFSLTLYPNGSYSYVVKPLDLKHFYLNNYQLKRHIRWRWLESPARICQVCGLTSLYSLLMDAQKLTSLGGSLMVPSVQELAKKTLTTVPPRYLRPERDTPFLSDSSTTCSSIHVPVIDFHRLVSGDVLDSELDKLHYACKDWGFFQVRNQFTCIKSRRPNWILRIIDELFLILIVTNKKI